MQIKIQSVNRFLVVAVIMILTSCSEDFDQILEIKDNVPGPSEKVFGSFNGLILDEDNQPIFDANVSIGMMSTFSNVDGYFTVSGFYESSGAPIQVRKEGYFDGKGLVIPHPDETVQVQVKLIRKEDPSIGQSDKVFTIDIDKADVVFEANSFVDQRGAAYSGEVEIYSAYLDPTKDDFNTTIPGGLKTANDEGDHLLLPYGVVEVELFGSDGRSLDINSPATISIQLSSEQLTDAPGDIALWYYDSETDLWIEDGQAELIDDQYVGEVNHFSTWSFSLKIPSFLISGTVYRNGAPYAYADVGIVYFGWYRSGWPANENGNYTWFILGERNYDLNVWNQCQVPIYTQNDNPPLTEDVVMDINIEGTSSSFDISGTVLCEGDPVNESYIIAYFEESDNVVIIEPSVDGSYKFLFDDCGLTDVQLTAVDIENDTRSNPLQIMGAGSFDLDVCETPFAGELIFEVEGQEPHVISNCFVTITDIVDPIIPGMKEYRFKAIDRFLNDPSIENESVDYDILIFHTEDPNAPLPPAGPTNPISNKTDGAPFMYVFSPFPYEMDLSNAGVVSVVMTEPWAWSRFGFIPAELTQELKGTIRINAIVQ